MLLDPDTLDLAPRAAAVLARLDGDPRFKPELPAAQFEIAARAGGLGPRRRPPRCSTRARDAARAADGLALLGRRRRPPVRPAASASLSAGERYAALRASTPSVAHRQLVFGLHVHVAIGGPDARAGRLQRDPRAPAGDRGARRGVAVLRGRATAALASVRPKLAELLPRQGIPPAFAAWDDYAGRSAWGGERGRLPGRAVVVGGAAAPGPRHARGPRRRRAGDRRRQRRARRGRPRAGRDARRRATTRASCRRRPRAGGSPRTAGRPRATASAGAGSTSATGRVRATREHLAALLARAGARRRAPGLRGRAGRRPRRASTTRAHERARLAGPHGLAASLAEHFLDVAGVAGPGAWAAPDRG